MSMLLRTEKYLEHLGRRVFRCLCDKKKMRKTIMRRSELETKYLKGKISKNFPLIKKKQKKIVSKSMKKERIITLVWMLIIYNKH